ncbi:MAG: hypothetical protein VX619_12355 [bacterium]|nr:hypothetical protein [bacterium]
MLAVNTQTDMNTNLQILANKTKLSLIAVTKIVNEYSTDLNLSRIPSSTEPLPNRLAENLYQILSYHKLGWSHGQVISHLRKTAVKTTKTNNNNAFHALFKGQSRLQQKMQIGIQLAEHLQSRVQLIEHSHKLENQLILTKLDLLIGTVEDLKKENEELKSELKNKTSTTYIIEQIKKWIYELF